MPQIGSAQGLTAFQVVQPISIVAETTTYAGVDLKGYVDEIGLILSMKRPNACASTINVTLLHSGDNSTFTAVTAPTFAQVTTATESIEKIEVNTKALFRYLQVKATTASASSTGTYVTSVIGVGAKKDFS